MHDKSWEAEQRWFCCGIWSYVVVNPLCSCCVPQLSVVHPPFSVIVSDAYACIYNYNYVYTYKYGIFLDGSRKDTPKSKSGHSHPMVTKSCHEPSLRNSKLVFHGNVSRIFGEDFTWLGTTDSPFTIWLSSIAMDNGSFYRWFMMIHLLKAVIFHLSMENREIFRGYIHLLCGSSHGRKGMDAKISSIFLESPDPMMTHIPMLWTIMFQLI